jgi:hypothetical protein
MIFSRTVTIRLRSRAVPYDRVHARYGYLSYIIKRRPATLVERFEKHAETLSVSVMTAAEHEFAPSWRAPANRSGIWIC